MTYDTQTTSKTALLMEALRDAVRSRRLASEKVTGYTLPQRLEQSLHEVERYRVVSAHWPLRGTTLPTRVLTLLQKLARRGLRWYINPIVEQQNAYNNTVAHMLRLAVDSYTDLATQLRAEMNPDALSQIDSTQRELQAMLNSFGSDSSPNITHKLQALVHERAATEPPVSFPDVQMRSLERELALRHQVNAHWQLGDVSLRQRTTGFVQKLVRRYLRWYINPIVEQQNAANTAIRAALIACVRLDAEQRAQVAAQRARHLQK